MAQQFVSRDEALAVAAAQGEGKSCAGGRQGGKADGGEHARGAGVPRIGNDEGAGSFVQGAKLFSFFVLRGWHVEIPFLRAIWLLCALPVSLTRRLEQRLA